MFRKLSMLMLMLAFAAVPSFSQEFTEITAMAFLPPEGNVSDKNLLSAYVSAADGAFTKAGYRMADRKRLQTLMEEITKQQKGGTMDDTAKSAQLGKLMKVSHFAEISINDVNSTAKDGALGASLKGVFGEVGTKIRVSIKIIEIESGIVVTTGTTTGTSASDPEKVVAKLVADMEKEQAAKNKKKAK